MPQLPSRQVLTWEQIADKARVFAEEYDLRNRQYPLDIEELAEFDLGIEIRFASDVFADFGSPAQIAPGEDHPVITVDVDQYRQHTSFYRFSLAHEIGHYVLHGVWLDAFRSHSKSVRSWRELLTSRSEDDYRWMESQAEEFASYILAPEMVFEPLFKEQLAKLGNVGSGLQADDVLSYLANPVGEYFGMSNGASQARIRKSQLWKAYSANHK